MSSGDYSHGRQDDQIWITIGITALTLLLLMVAWHFLHTYLAWGMMQLMWITLPSIEWINTNLKSINTPAIIVNLITPEALMIHVEEVKYWLPRTDARRISFSQFTLLAEIFGYFSRLCLPFLGIWGCRHVYKRTKAARLKRVLNIFTLSKFSMKSFPQIRPAIIADLFKKDPDEGEYRREDSPIRFAIKNHLLKAYDVDFKGNLLPNISIPTFDESQGKQKGYMYVKDHLAKSISTLHNRCILDEEKTEAIFIKQLGKPWTKSSDLPPFVRSVYAVLITFACSDKDAAFKLIDQMNASWMPPETKRKYKWLPFLKKTTYATLDTSGSEELIKKYEKNERIQHLLKSHAYVNTMLPTLLQEARSKGKLSSAMFLWIMAIDRTLWYSLNQEGGQCGWTEAAGPRAHKLAEQKSNGPIYEPFVSTAVAAYEKFLSDVEGWIPLPENEPVMDKKEAA